MINPLSVCWFLALSILGMAQNPEPASSANPAVTIVAVSRDQSRLAAGLGPSRWAQPGNVVVEPIARLTQSGKWDRLPCVPGTGKGCEEFAREYLSKPHIYTVVSADGRGTSIHAAATTLSECYDFTGKGTYTGGSLAYSAIAASSDELFNGSPPLKLLDDEGGAQIYKAVAAATRFGATQQLRIWVVNLEAQSMLVVQRASGDEAKTKGKELSNPVFAIGTMVQGSFRVLDWNHHAPMDEDEHVLGTIRLKTGEDFLVTVVSDSESHSFRVYGVRSGRIVLTYSGGGSSC